MNEYQIARLQALKRLLIFLIVIAVLVIIGLGSAWSNTSSQLQQMDQQNKSLSDIVAEQEKQLEALSSENSDLRLKYDVLKAARDAILERRADEYEGAHAEGYKEGYEAGRDAGYSAGYAAGKQSVSYGNNSTSSGGSNYTYSQTVYITATGSKYHRFGCQYLRQSCYAISLSSAKSQGYTACSRCW